MLKYCTPAKVFSVAIAVLALTLAYGVYVGKIDSGVKEKSVATLFSALLLAATSRVCFRVHRLKSPGAAITGGLRDHRFIWLFLGYSFGFLALDELLQIHENIDKLIHYIAGMEETAWSDRIDDFILLLYALTGLFVLYVYRAEILNSPRLIYFLKLAICFGAISLVVDFLNNRGEYIIWLQIDESLHKTVDNWVDLLEESTKILAGASLLSGFATVLHALEKAEPVDTRNAPHTH